MIHPLLRLAATEPHLLGDHVEAYAELVGDEVEKVSSDLKRQAALYAAAALLLVVGLVLVGTATLLWAALPGSNYTAPWAMVVVPAVPLVASALCVAAARAKKIEGAFATLRKQLQADMAMLREVSAP